MLHRLVVPLKLLATATATAVVVLAVVGRDVTGFFVGHARWKEIIVDDTFSLLFLATVVAATVAARRLGRGWTQHDPTDHRTRRRLIAGVFAFAIAAPMLVVNTRSLGRVVVYDHPRKDLGWKEELIDAAVWLSDHRILVVVVALATVAGRRVLTGAST